MALNPNLVSHHLAKYGDRCGYGESRSGRHLHIRSVASWFRNLLTFTSQLSEVKSDGFTHALLHLFARRTGCNAAFHIWRVSRIPRIRLLNYD
jgi:hypothetical protein